MVAKGLAETFDKPPPPKKKWIQDYLEKSQHSDKPDVDDDESAVNGCDDDDRVGGGSDVDGVVQVVMDRFQDYMQQQAVAETKKKKQIVLHNNLKGDEDRGYPQPPPSPPPRSNFRPGDSDGSRLAVAAVPATTMEAAAAMEQLLSPANYGDKFNRSLLRLSNSTISQPPARVSASLPPTAVTTFIPPAPQQPPIYSQQAAASPAPPTVKAAPASSLSQHDIGGVVQGVISSFLNGSLADSNFRQSRKRSHRHSSGAKRIGGGDWREQSKRQRTEMDVMLEAGGSGQAQPEPLVDETGVLNLSLPKPSASKVTFAREDRCYSQDSGLRSSKTSKSQEMLNEEERERRDGGRKKYIDVAAAARTGNIHTMPLATVQVENNHSSQTSNCSPPPPVCPPTSITPAKGFIVPKPLSSLLQVPDQLSSVAPPVKPFIPTPVIQSSEGMQVSLQQQHRVSPQPPPLLVTSPANAAAASLTTRSSIIVSTTGSSPRSLLSDSVPSQQTPAAHPSSDNSSKSAASKRDGSSSPRCKEKTVSSTKDSAVVSKGSKTEATVAVNIAATAAVGGGDGIKEDNCKKNSSGYTREMHNMMEKNRRAQLKQCFDEVARLCELDPKKTSNLAVIRSAHKFIIRLRRKEREQETELTELAKQKASLKQRLHNLRA